MSGHLSTVTRSAYDVVADDYATLIRGLSAETALDVAMINDFGGRCRKDQLGAVADVGCGPGRITAHLAERGVDVFGYDLSPGMVKVARRTHPHLRFEVSAMEDMNIPDATLGGLIAWYSLIHTAPDGLPTVVSEFARAVKAGGWLLTAFQTGAGERIERSSAYGHAVTMINYRHDPRHLIVVLEAGGFDVHTQLQRSAEGTETTPQTVLLARRRK